MLNHKRSLRNLLYFLLNFIIFINPSISNNVLTIPPIINVKTNTFAFTQIVLFQSEKSTAITVNCLLFSINNAHTSLAKAIQILIMIVANPAFIHPFTFKYLITKNTIHTPLIITNATINPIRIPSKSPKWLQTSNIVR